MARPVTFAHGAQDVESRDHRETVTDADRPILMVIGAVRHKAATRIDRAAKIHELRPVGARHRLDLEARVELVDGQRIDCLVDDKAHSTGLLAVGA